MMYQLKYLVKQLEFIDALDVFEAALGKNVINQERYV